MRQSLSTERDRAAHSRIRGFRLRAATVDPVGEAQLAVSNGAPEGAPLIAQQPRQDLVGEHPGQPELDVGHRDGRATPRVRSGK